MIRRGRPAEQAWMTGREGHSPLRAAASNLVSSGSSASSAVQVLTLCPPFLRGGIQLHQTHISTPENLAPELRIIGA